MLYSDERHIQQLISLLKQYKICNIIVSPGSSNVPLVASLQSDSFFKMISCVDERSAAYMACGMSAELNAPVALTCTGATASRNYLPGLTEAFYRKLPVLAITASMNTDRTGHLFPQMLDRSSMQRDICVESVTVKPIKNGEDKWANEIAINNVLLSLTRYGGGPAHINMVSEYGKSFTAKKLLETRKIDRYVLGDEKMPVIPKGKVAVYIGAHRIWSDGLTRQVECFCETNDAVVIVDHTSNYGGKYSVLASVISMQEQYASPLLEMDLLVHIGEVSGSYYRLKPKQVWRVSPDGALRDLFGCLTHVFEMEEEQFFGFYAEGKCAEMRYYSQFSAERNFMIDKLPELPFSNIWCASKAASLVPAESVMHFGILNSLRSWNIFELDSSIRCYSNTGGFGIDGCVSAMLGGALAKTDRLHFIVLGDLAFFYDLNAIGLRECPKNSRILLINNGIGVEFKNYNNIAAQFGDETNLFIAAKGHYAAQSDVLVSSYVKALGFDYLSAKTKEEFLDCAKIFFSGAELDRPMLLEVFTADRDESDALRIVNNLETSISGALVSATKNMLGEKGKSTLKKIMRKKKVYL